MIRLTRLNGQPLMVNSDLITLISTAPDTVLTLITGEKIVVGESCEQILDKIVEFRRKVLNGLSLHLAGQTPLVDATPPEEPRDEEEQE